MKIKRYLVKNMYEAYERIKEDLGDEAVIISSRKVRTGGLWGFFGAKMVEVIAALGKEASSSKPGTKQGGVNISDGMERE